jgi:hypothetical protein
MPQSEIPGGVGNYIIYRGDRGIGREGKDRDGESITYLFVLRMVKVVE